MDQRKGEKKEEGISFSVREVGSGMRDMKKDGLPSSRRSERTEN